MTAHTLGGTLTIGGRGVPRIGYGMGSLHRSAEAADGHQDAIGVLEAAYDLGVRMFDTAHFYGDGLANQLIREALGTHRDELLIASKVGARSTPEGPFPMAAAQKPSELRDSVEINLRTLETDRLDLVYMRRMDAQPGLIADGDQQVPLEDQLSELLALREEGKILGIGLSHVSLEQLRTAYGHGAEVQAVQNIYGLIDRHDQALLDLCAEQGTAWIPYFPLGGGFHNAPRVADDGTVQRIAAANGLTASQVGQAWLLHCAPNTALISGTSQIAHLKENVAAGDVQLSDEEWSELDTLG
ncbi:aldo/keto reductase [Brachybacterium endophyticum]|uniref:Aldo/keto reductase n=1 Tax=Brachybacterium endophyticum TaxID=2182385 RepID=A0A2U2RMX0_9MICO|nr:aldo/keto reductase [Brachybacterium endophyticum]PWH07219.1 aldo/keto reductase [Brachybacterium endophyticum]